MKQAVLTAPFTVSIVEKEPPTLAEGECLLKVETALICGTDIRIFEGTKTKNVTLPSVLGHEFSGIIVDSHGALPPGLSIGNRVSVYPLLPCGNCAACARGKENICRNRKAFGYQIPGGLADYVVIPAEAVKNGNLVPVGDTDPDSAALIEPLACALNGQRLAGVHTAESVLIVGCGPLGLMHIKLAKALGVPNIIAIDPIDSRRAAAQAAGANHVLSPAEATDETLHAATDGVGFDSMIIAVGRADAMEPYLSQLAPGGKVNVFAGFPHGTDTIKFSANDLHYNEHVLVGSSSCHLSDFTEVSQLIQSGALDVSNMVTSRFPLEQLENALERVKTGLDLRIAVDA